MAELENDDSFIAMKQREDAMNAMKSVSSEMLKIAVSVPLIAAVAISATLGTGMTVIILLVGATAGGAVIDHFGLLGAAQKSLTVRKVVGILGMLAGAAAIKLF